MEKVEIIKGNRVVGNMRKGLVISRQRVAAYCRVSTDKKEQKSSYQIQMRYYEQMIREKPEWEFVGIYADEGITGTMASKRDEFLRMINDCANGKIDMVITKSISRFARNTLEVLQYVRLLRDKNVAVLFEEENINTLTMDGEMLLTVLSSVYQQEVENTSAHIMRGLHMRMERGEPIGFQGCLGYDYHKGSKTITVNRKEAEIIRYIYQRYLEGAGGAMIARELENLGWKTKIGNTHWNPGSVISILCNEKYTGTLLMGKSYTVDPITKRRLTNNGESNKYSIKNHHEPIISTETFEKVQEIRKNRGKHYNHVKVVGNRQLVVRRYAFSCMMECGFCGATYSRRSAHSGSAYSKVIWQCMGAVRKGVQECPHSKAIDEAAIEKAFMDSYKMVCSQHEGIVEELLGYAKEALQETDIVKRREEVEKQRKEMQKKNERLIEMRLDDAIDEVAYKGKFHELSEKTNALDLELHKLNKMAGQEIDIEKRMEEFKRALQEPVSQEHFNRAVFDSVVEKIIIGGYDKDDKPNSYKITFIYKIGITDEKDGSKYKTPRRSLAKKNKKIDGSVSNGTGTQSELSSNISSQVSGMSSSCLTNIRRVKKNRQ